MKDINSTDQNNAMSVQILFMETSQIFSLIYSEMNSATSEQGLKGNLNMQYLMK